MHVIQANTIDLVVKNILKFYSFKYPLVESFDADLLIGFNTTVDVCQVGLGVISPLSLEALS